MRTLVKKKNNQRLHIIAPLPPQFRHTALSFTRELSPISEVAPFALEISAFEKVTSVTEVHKHHRLDINYDYIIILVYKKCDE